MVTHMKYLTLIFSAALLLISASCSRQSAADKEQLQNAHQGAQEMLKTIHTDSLAAK